MGKANAMGGPANMILNTICYSMVFVIFRVQPRVALKVQTVVIASARAVAVEAGGGERGGAQWQCLAQGTKVLQLLLVAVFDTTEPRRALKKALRERFLTAAVEKKVPRSASRRTREKSTFF